MYQQSTTDEIVSDILSGPGFHILHDAVSQDQLAQVKEIVQRLRVEKGPGFFPDKTNRERIFGIIYEGTVFQDIAAAPLPIARQALGTDHISLSSFSIHTVNPGTGSIGMHVDYPYGEIAEPLPRIPVLGLQLIWAIDEFTEANGATICCPGSQLNAAKPPRSVGTDVERRQLCAPAGSLIITHCLCWHDSGENSSPSPRTALLANLTPSYIKPIEYPYFEVRNPTPIVNSDVARMLGLEFYDVVANATDLQDMSHISWRKKKK